MNKTSIEWCRTYAADGTFTEGFSVNPVRFRPHGTAGSDGRPARLVTMCQKVSPGCAHCYAETISRRFWPKDALVQLVHPETHERATIKGFPGYTALGVSPEMGEFVLDEKTLLSVLKQKKPARVFWGDMTDLFGEWVKDEWLDRMFAVCALTPHLTHIWLTKRPERMLAYMTSCVGRLADVIEANRTDAPRRAVGPLPNLDGGQRWFPLPNVWLGVSVENQKAADERISLLLQTPAAVRFLSVEPMMGAVDLQWWLISTCRMFDTTPPNKAGCDGPSCKGRRIDWVICGGESGPGARPMHPDWVRKLRDSCAAADVPFFFKQWGQWAPGGQQADYRKADQAAFERINLAGEEVRHKPELHCATDGMMYRGGKKAAGRLLDGREWNEMPEADHA